MMAYYEEQLRLQPTDHNKAVWAVVAVWRTTKDGFNLNSETNMTNKKHCFTVMNNLNLYDCCIIIELDFKMLKKL